MTELFHIQVQKLFTINLSIIHEISHQQTRYFFRISIVIWCWCTWGAFSFLGATLRLRPLREVPSSLHAAVTHAWKPILQSAVGKQWCYLSLEQDESKAIFQSEPLNLSRLLNCWFTKKEKEPWKNLEVIGKLLFCCPSLNESDIHCSPFFILHPKLPWMCWY